MVDIPALAPSEKSPALSDAAKAQVKALNANGQMVKVNPLTGELEAGENEKAADKVAVDTSVAKIEDEKIKYRATLMPDGNIKFDKDEDQSKASATEKFKKGDFFVTTKEVTEAGYNPAYLAQISQLNGTLDTKHALSLEEVKRVEVDAAKKFDEMHPDQKNVPLNAKIAELTAKRTEEVMLSPKEQKEMHEQMAAYDKAHPQGQQKLAMAEAHGLPTAPTPAPAVQATVSYGYNPGR